MRYIVSMLVLFVLCGCRKEGGIPEIVIPSEDALDDAARANLHLPAKDEFTRVTDADAEYVKTLSPDVNAAIEHSIKPRSAKFRIMAARPVGEYLLLWIYFPQGMDGGQDLIYSAEKRKIVGEFLGGYRG